jgi:hypothetical protein
MSEVTKRCSSVHSLLHESPLRIAGAALLATSR